MCLYECVCATKNLKSHDFAVVGCAPGSRMHAVRTIERP